MYSPLAAPENSHEVLPSSNAIDRRQFLHGLTAASVLLIAQTLEADEKRGAPEDHAKVQKLIDDNWAKQRSMYEKIAEVGMQKYYDSLEDKKEAFFSRSEIIVGNGVCACCSDEGNRKYPMKGSDNKMVLHRTPGAGILHALDKENKDAFDPDFIDSSAQTLLTEGVTVVTGHAGCGAAKAVFNARIAWLEKNGKTKEADALRTKGSDTYAQEWAKLVGERMRKIAGSALIDHAESIHSDFIKVLDRPAEIHVASILYLTDDDEFDASYEGLPQGFVERTGTTDLGKVLQHVDVLRDIAFNKEHAFGSKISEKPSEQFVICCIAHTPQRLNVLKAHAEQARQKLPKEVQGKIRIDGFIPER